jgi:amino acid transporter
MAQRRQASLTDARSETGVPSTSLRRVVSGSGFFTLAFGAIVGSGWVIVLGEWLREAGPGGAVLAFAVGAIVMMLIALCYGELAGRFPRAGAEFLYMFETFGADAAFIVAWYLTLYAIAACAFEGIALGWVCRAMWPQLDLGVAYTVFGAQVSWAAIAIGVVGTVVVGGLHFQGGAWAIRFQNLVTYGFIIISGVLIVSALALGKGANLQPLFPDTSGRGWRGGAVWIFASCAFFLNGWQTALHAIEERRSATTPRGAVVSMIAAVATAALFYAALVVAVGMALPWQRLVGSDLPAVTAFRALPGAGALGTVLLGAAAVSLAKTWSAMMWVASRLLYSQARCGLLPARLLGLHPVSGAPRAAIVVVMLVSLAGILAGRGIVVPIVNMVSTCIALSFILCLVVLLRVRRVQPTEGVFTVPGGRPTILMALGGAVAMVGIAVGRPLLDRAGGLPLEWVMLLSWGGIGLCVRGVVKVVSRARMREMESKA